MNSYTTRAHGITVKYIYIVRIHSSIHSSNALYIVIETLFVFVSKNVTSVCLIFHARRSLRTSRQLKYIYIYIYIYEDLSILVKSSSFSVPSLNAV